MSGCDYNLPIIPGNLVFRGQIGVANVGDAGKPIIRVIKNPADNSNWLRNISEGDMNCITPSGKQILIANGSAAPANQGLSLRFANGYVTVL